MRGFLAALSVLAIWALGAVAQVPWQNAAPGTRAGGGGGAFVGIGDLAVTDSFTVLGYWGLRAYKAATATTANMASICDSAGANCTIMKGNSNGTMNLTTLSPSGTNCVSAANCTITTLYGGVGTEGNMVPGTRPSLAASGAFSMSKPVAFCSDLSGMYLQSSTNLGGSIPATYIAVVASDATEASSGIMGDQTGTGNGLTIISTGTAAQVTGNVGGLNSSAISASKWYAVVGVSQVGGSTSHINVNGTDTTSTTSPGTSWGGSGGWQICRDTGWTTNGGFYVGEIAVISGDRSAQISDLLNNMKNFWGFTYP